MKKLVCLVLALAMVLSLSVGVTATAENEKVFIIGLGGEPTSYNADAVTDDYSYQVCQSIFSSLVTLNTNSEIIPDLAESWTISDDSLVYTFNLRKGVKWHDGVDFTSADVKFTFEKIVKENGYLAKDLAAVDTIECPDDFTVVITLKQATAPFLASLAWYQNFILPQHIYDVEEDWNSIEAATTHPIGTGPFKFVEATTGVSITVEKNPDYFYGEPQVDKIVYVIMSDSDTAYQAFLNGEIDYLTDVPASVVNDMKADPAYSLGCLSAARRFQMCFNMNGEITSNLLIRQAVAKCLDRNEISVKGTNSLQAPAYGFYPPFLDWAYNDQVDIGEQDLDAAVKLLEEAGLTKDETGNYLHLSLLVFKGGTYADCGKVIRSQCAKAGIDVTVEILDEGSWVEKVFSGNFDMCMLAGNQGPDPNNMTNRVGTGGGLKVSFYSNPAVDDLLAQARVIANNEERGKLYKEVQRILSEDLPLVPLVEYAAYFACPSNITGIPYIDAACSDVASWNFCKVAIN